jgi:uncharacterized protein
MQNPYHITKLEDLFALSPWAQPATEILRKEMQFDPGHDEGHIVRVVRNALWFAEDGDVDVIIPAALLHDLINVPKSDRENRPKASTFSADKATELLYQGDRSLPEYDEHRLQVYHAIQAHSWSANITPTTFEAKAVQDADRCDCLGLIGVSRCMAVSGIMGRTLFDPIDPDAQHRALDEYKYGIDHFKTKLFGLKDTMQTDIGRRYAAYQTAKMQKFYIDLVHEILGEDDMDQLYRENQQFRETMISMSKLAYEEGVRFGYAAGRENDDFPSGSWANSTALQTLKTAGIAADSPTITVTLDADPALAVARAIGWGKDLTRSE